MVIPTFGLEGIELGTTTNCIANGILKICRALKNKSAARWNGAKRHSASANLAISRWTQPISRRSVAGPQPHNRRPTYTFAAPSPPSAALRAPATRAGNYLRPTRPHERRGAVWTGALTGFAVRSRPNVVARPRCAQSGAGGVRPPAAYRGVGAPAALSRRHGSRLPALRRRLGPAPPGARADARPHPLRGRPPVLWAWKQ